MKTLYEIYPLCFNAVDERYFSEHIAPIRTYPCISVSRRFHLTEEKRRRLNSMLVYVLVKKGYWA